MDYLYIALILLALVAVGVGAAYRPTKPRSKKPKSVDDVGEKGARPKTKSPRPQALPPRGQGQGEPEPVPEATPPESVTMSDTDRDSVAVSTTEAKPYDVERVFFGTDRAVESEDTEHITFGGGRANALTLGWADVSIPKRHELGKVERPKHYKIMGYTVYRQSEKLDQHFTIISSKKTDRPCFTELASEEVARAERFQNTAFIFLHGFNVTFENALFRTAQLSYDLGFDGATYLYSWPAQGKALSYATDMDSAMHAAPHLDAFIDTVLRTPGIEKVHLVAHSMGNFALAELVRRVGMNVQQAGKFIDQLILAAPDIDVDLFKDVSKHFVKHANNVTLYACASDKALLVAREIRDDYRRAGDVPEHGPVVVDGVDSIDITAVGSQLFSLNHSTYAEDRGLLNDLGLIMLRGVHPPDLRMPTLRVVDGIGGRYWVMPV